MGLNEKSDTVNWSPSHYVFIEKEGPFQNTAPAAWQELHAKLPDFLKKNKATAYTSLYKVEPKMIYRAGVMVAEKPAEIPAGMKYEKFEGGKYCRFVLTGSYAQLPEACGRVFEIVKKSSIPVRPGYFMENYVNDPRTTAEDQLITEIMLPVN